MSTVRTVVAVVLLTLVAAAAGVWVGLRIGGGTGPRDHHHTAGLDEMLHHELGLSLEQDQRIAALEAKFAGDRKALEAEMHAANQELARALETERGYGDAAKAAIGHFHAAMAKLQELTILHVMDMRAALTPEQAAKFDRTVQQALDPP